MTHFGGKVEIGWKYPKRLRMLSTFWIVELAGVFWAILDQWKNLGKGETFSPHRANTAKTLSVV